MNYTTAYALAGVLLISTHGAVASAQTLERPPRSVGGIFGGRRPAPPEASHQELTLSIDFLGGFDDNLSPEGDGGGVSTNPYAARASGYAGTASGEITYWRGRGTRFLEASGRTYLTTYSELFTEPLIGGEGRIEAANSGWGRNGVNFNASADYRPSFALGAFGPIAGEVEPGALPETNPTAGVSELQSFNTALSGGLDRNWTRRQRTGIAYEFSRREFTGQQGLDTRVHGANVSHTWELLRGANLRGAYHYSDQALELPEGGRRPLRTHAADLGLELRRRFSPTRALVFSFGGGANHVQTRAGVDDSALEYTVPSAYGSFRFDFAQTWALSADMRRTVSVLEGLSTQSFVTNATAVRAGGQLTGGLSLALSAGFSRANAPAGAIGSFESFNGSLQFDYAVARWFSLVTSYNYYDHLLRGITGIPEGFPRRFQRNSIRAGMTIWLPLYGSFQSERGRSRGSN